MWYGINVHGHAKLVRVNWRVRVSDAVGKGSAHLGNKCVNAKA